MTNRFADFTLRQRPATSARAFPSASEFLRRYRDDGERLVAQPFEGITTDGTVAPGLFTLGKTGVSTRPLKEAADAFLAALAPTPRAEALFPLETDPVVLVEFDHQRGIALASDQPSRTHIHTVIRTPNGNDYGRDLLRQHHARFDHARPDHTHETPTRR